MSRSGRPDGAVGSDACDTAPVMNPFIPEYLDRCVAIQHPRHRIVVTIRADAEGPRNCQGIVDAIAVLLELHTQSRIVN
jgi:hypothetical protein